MDTVIDHDALPRHGRPAPVARTFGWAMLTILLAFLVNNILVVWFGFPGLRGIEANLIDLNNVRQTELRGAIGVLKATGAKKR